MARRPPGRLRVIGGEWRSRLIEFDAASGLRPTPDRVRQTLFDWLAPVIEGARCLDLFAGSGALGLEALSRGARHVTFVEAATGACTRIRAALEKLGAGARAEVRAGDALSFLAGPVSARFDIVFLDPPYDAGLLGPALERLPVVLAPGNRVYFEFRGGAPPPVPAWCERLREKQAGQVSYVLATCSGPPA